MATGPIGCIKTLQSNASTLSFWSSSLLPFQSFTTWLFWYYHYQFSGGWSFNGRRKPMLCSCSRLEYSLSYVALGDSRSYWRWSILWTHHVSVSLNPSWSNTDSCFRWSSSSRAVELPRTRSWHNLWLSSSIPLLTWSHVPRPQAISWRQYEW